MIKLLSRIAAKKVLCKRTSSARIPRQSYSATGALPRPERPLRLVRRVAVETAAPCYSQCEGGDGVI